MENGLPTFVGVTESALAVCISDFTVPSAVLDGSGGGGDEDWGGNGRVAAAFDFHACLGGGGGGGSAAACLIVNTTEMFLSDKPWVQTSVYPFLNTPTLLDATVSPEYAKAAYGGADGAASGVAMTALGWMVNFVNKTVLSDATATFGLPTPEVAIYPGPYGPGEAVDCRKFLNFGTSSTESDLDAQTMAEYGQGANLGFLSNNMLLTTDLSMRVRLLKK